MSATRANVFRRLAARMGLGPTKPVARSVYAGARVNHTVADWFARQLSADQAIRHDIRALRDRARQLVRDNAFAARYVRLCEENVVITGMQCRTGNEALDTAVETAWQDWSESTYASADGKHDLDDLARLAVRGWKGVEGESLTRLVRLERSPVNPYGFALQVLDTDYLDHTYNVPATAGGAEIRMGVEVNGWGRPLRYWLFRTHPSEGAAVGASYERYDIAAEELIHLYTCDRPGQTRGVTPFAPVMTNLRTLGAYYEAEVLQARAAACPMGIIEMSPEAIPDPNDPNASSPPEWELEPLSVNRLGPGEKFTQWKSDHPNIAFETFTNQMLYEIAAGLGVSFASLTGNLDKANYGSNRVGLTTERENWYAAMDCLADDWYARVFREWINAAVFAGKVPGLRPSGIDAVVKAVRFQTRGFDWIDPKSDAEAKLTLVAAGADTLTRLCAEQGRDFKDVIRERADEIALAKRLGVDLVLPVRPVAAVTNDVADGGTGKVDAAGAPTGGPAASGSSGKPTTGPKKVSA